MATSHRLCSAVDFLADASIRENVAFGVEHDAIDNERVWKVLESAYLSEYVNQLPHKINTRVGERGVQISGGQRQRIGIARALYRNPSVLIMDEATSALDGLSERAVMDAIDNLSGQKTIIMVAHRLATVRHCSKIFS